MVKKSRTIRTFAKTAPKTKEKKLLENAKKIKENPFVFFPECRDAKAEKFINKIKRKIKKTWKNKDDVKKLEKLSKKKGLEGAVAGTLMLTHSKKAPYLATARIGNMDVMYALRGKAKKEFLIAVQNFDDPVLRLLAFKDLAVKNKVCLYSWGKNFVCTGENSEPPDDFKNYVLKKVGFDVKNGVASCPHVNPEKLREGASDERNYLRIEWKNANVVIGICENCASKDNRNTVFEISKFFIDPNINKNISVKVVPALIELQDENQDTSTYLLGGLTDTQLITKTMEKWKEKLKSSKKKVLIADGISYGDDVERFIEALKPNEYERKGLEFILPKIDEPVILEDGTPNKLFEIYWKKYGRELISSIVKDEDLTDKLLSIDETPSKIIETAVKTVERKKKLAEYPDYKKLPSTAKFVDDLVKNYLLFGEQKVLTLLSKPPEETKKRSIAFAFLLAIGKGEERKWQYSDVEVEYGKFLKEYVEKLLNASPKEYDRVFKELIKASGSDEKIQ
ncbi:MAG TPA: hypothetical protein ENI42_06615 [Thermoplasmatales archaeon]|nr:hypothetical protein [Thermoplasmatales archaeon]